MRVALVGPDLEENLSIRYLSSSLQAKGHQAVIVTFDTAEDHDEALAAADDTDMVALSMCYQVRAPEFLRLAAASSQDARPERWRQEGGVVCRVRWAAEISPTLVDDWQGWSASREA